MILLYDDHKHGEPGRGAWRGRELWNMERFFCAGGGWFVYDSAAVGVCLWGLRCVVLEV